MKVQIRRLSPHQNASVAAVLMLAVSLPLFMVMALVMWFGGPQVSDQGAPAAAFPIFMFLVLPFFYLILVYILVAAICAIYNFISGFIGGFELDLVEQEHTGQNETH